VDKEPGELPPLVYDNDLYGLHLRAPVFKETGPFVSHSDCPHGRKTGRNQPQHGTKTASLGDGYVVNRSLVQLCNVPGSGLVRADVDKVDKQDDGAARRAFHFNALKAQTQEENGVFSIKPEFTGLFAYSWVLGKLLLERPILYLNIPINDMRR
jgi:hypothetical protein